MYCPEYDDPANCAAEEDQYRQAGDLYGTMSFDFLSRLISKHLLKMEKFLIDFEVMKSA